MYDLESIVALGRQLVKEANQDGPISEYRTLLADMRLADAVPRWTLARLVAERIEIFHAEGLELDPDAVY